MPHGMRIPLILHCEMHVNPLRSLTLRCLTAYCIWCNTLMIQALCQPLQIDVSFLLHALSATSFMVLLKCLKKHWHATHHLLKQQQCRMHRHKYMHKLKKWENTTALKVPGRSLCRALVEPNPIWLPWSTEKGYFLEGMAVAWKLAWINFSW